MGPFPAHLFSSWRRKGIGSFLMKLIIKSCKEVQTEHADSIDVETPITFEVSTSKGTEAPPADVIDVDAPDAIVTTVKGSTSVIDVDAPDAILTPVKGSTSVIDVDAAVCIDGDATALPVMWCRYPPTAQQQRDVTTRLLYNDFVAATSGLSHIRVLLPHPLQDPLCPPDAFCVGGEMSIRRIQREKNGTGYISLGELDMMLAVIMADGRYNDHVTIIPCSYTKNVSLASEAYSDYVNARLQLQF
ncbi:hypothetical protein MHU86_25484 [Fragilaria crotonensis]|nr:hypothetical protein MHU86_25484 [Fragilaria crotonensis]